MNPDVNKQLMEKLQKQGVVPGNPQAPGSGDGVVMGDVPDMEVLDSAQNQHIQQHGLSMTDPKLMKEGNTQNSGTEEAPEPKEIAPQPLTEVPPQTFETANTQVPPQPRQVPHQPRRVDVAQEVHIEPEQPVRKPSITEQIKAVEAELGRPSASASQEVTARSRSFMDEFGDETFYVQNESNSHCAISDLDLTVNRGECDDLLRHLPLEQLKKSRDLRAMLAGNTATGMSLLRRLTPEEYLHAIKIQRENKQKIDELKAEFAPNKPENSAANQRVRPTILSKLEKLRLFSIPENRHQGMPPIEFTQWAMTENLTLAELDYVIAHPNVIAYPEILTALYEKRKTMS